MGKGSKREILLIVGGVVIAVGLYFGVNAYQARSTDEASMNAAASGEHPVTLDPALFTGPVREAYQIARDNPALIAQLHCYCGCDKDEGHKNLLDCYRDSHGSRCEICIGESLQARRMFEQGAPIEQIRDAVRTRYAHQG
jgi:hypothetical protein